jgi:hypothetical protein
MQQSRMTKPNDIPKLLTIADLSVRWDMPRQSLHDKKGENKFPLPVQYVANNRTALFLESDIIEYEKENPYIKTRAQREARRNFIFKLYMDANDE